MYKTKAVTPWLLKNVLGLVKKELVELYMVMFVELPFNLCKKEVEQKVSNFVIIPRKLQM